MLRAKSSTVIGETLTKLLDIDTEEYEHLFLQMTVVTNAIDSFSVQAQADEEAAWVDIKTATGDFTTPAGDLIKASGDLNAAAVGTGHYLRMNIGAYRKMRINAASGNAAGSTVKLYVSGS